MSDDTTEDTLSVNHRKFVEQYVALGVGVRAYMAVYPESGYEAARVSSSQLLAKPRIKEAVAQRKANLMDELGITQQWVIEKMQLAAEKALHSMSPASAARPLELLGRQHGLFTEKVEQTSTQTVYTLDMGKALEEGNDEA